MTDPERPGSGGPTARIVDVQRQPTVRVSADGRTPDSEGNLARESRPGDPDHAERLVGRILAGRYEVKRVLGRGGMGIVYEARHVTVGRTVAIKVLRHDLARSTEAVARFHREAKAAAAIGSEHIVEVFDFGYSEDGDAYIAMELLEGEDLGKIVRRDGPLAEARAVNIAKQIGRALDAAHAKGIIHRDLKSENVFIAQRNGADFVKLLDFGISKVSEGDEGRGPMTSEGVVMGTPHYMAPEQAMSDIECDHRIDVYALGCLMYEMLTGHVPFTGKNPVEVVFKHVHEAPVSVRKVRPELGVVVDRVVMRALAKKREDRYATAGALVVALGEPEPAPGESVEVVARARERKGHGRVIVSLVVAAGLVAGGAMAWRGRSARGSESGGVGGVGGGGVQGRVVRPVVLGGQGQGQGQGQGVQQDAGRGGVIEVRDTALSITALPRTATIGIDGETFGVGSVSERFVRGSAHRVTIEELGFAPVTRDVVLNAPYSENVVLQALPTGNGGRVLPGARADAGRVAGSEGTTAGRDAGAGVSGAAGSDGSGMDIGEGLKATPYGGGGGVR